MSIPTIKDCPNCKWHDPEHCRYCLTAEANEGDAPSDWEPGENYTETDPRCTECEAGYTARIAALEADIAAARAELSALKDAIDATEAAYPLDIWPEPGPSSIDHEFWTRRVELAAASMARRTCRNIRAALDPPQEVGDGG